MRKLLVLVLVTGLTATLAAVALADTKRVKIGDNWFVRASGVPTVTVRKGDTVKWVWTGRSMHNVTVVRGPVKFRSSTKSDGTYSKRVRTRGTYTIVCTVHGGADQKMKLVVK